MEADWCRIIQSLPRAGGSDPSAIADCNPNDCHQCQGLQGERFKVKEGSASTFSTVLQHSSHLGEANYSQLEVLGFIRGWKKTFLKSLTWKERQSMQTSDSVRKPKHLTGLKSWASTVLPSPSSPLNYTGFLVMFLEKTWWFSRLAPGDGQFLFLALPLRINFNQIVIKKIIISLQVLLNLQLACFLELRVVLYI